MDMMLRCLWLWIQLERQPLLLADHAARQTLDDNAIDAASVATQITLDGVVLSTGRPVVMVCMSVKTLGRLEFRLFDTHCPTLDLLTPSDLEMVLSPFRGASCPNLLCIEHAWLASLLQLIRMILLLLWMSIAV